MPILTEFTPDAQRLAIFKECIDNYSVGDEDPYWPNSEWPNNMISRQTVVYGNGTIARANETVTFAVDSEELDLCIRLANEATELMKGVHVGMGSEGGDEFSPFWVCANGDEIPLGIDVDLIRARFGDTLFPPAKIKVEPVCEKSDMFTWVREDYEESAEDDPENAAEYIQALEKWRQLFQWFNNRSDFKDTACVSIGHTKELWKLPKEQYPLGTVLTPCVLPRMILGLTHGGSLCGLFGFTIQT